MKSSAICVLLGLTFAVPLSVNGRRSSPRLLSASESSNVRGSFDLPFVPSVFFACGTANGCEVNKCNDNNDDCKGQETVAGTGPNKGCSVPNLNKLCLSWGDIDLENPFPQKVSCAQVSGRCIASPNGCIEDMNESGTVLQPTGNDNCVDADIVPSIF
jgi:hypothetical protein